MPKRRRRNSFPWCAMHAARSLPVVWFLIILCMQGLAQGSKGHGHAESFGIVTSDA